MRLHLGPWNRHDVVRYKNVNHKLTKLDHFQQNNFNSTKKCEINLYWLVYD